MRTEAGLVAAVVLLRHVIPLLQDKTFLEVLQVWFETFCDHTSISLYVQCIVSDIAFLLYGIWVKLYIDQEHCEKICYIQLQSSVFIGQGHS